MAETREAILEHARMTAQAHGYDGLNFRELAAAVGVKSASVHHHFPTKADLGVALARRYRDDAAAALAAIRARARDTGQCLQAFTDLYREALETGNRMCMCGQMAAEYDDLPAPIRAEVTAFVDMNVAWLTDVLADAIGADTRQDIARRALAIYAAISGAQLTARSRGDVAAYDDIVQGYREAGLIPG